jgi:hypothetical protein
LRGPPCSISIANNDFRITTMPNSARFGQRVADNRAVTVATLNLRVPGDPRPVKLRAPTHRVPGDPRPVKRRPFLMSEGGPMGLLIEEMLAVFKTREQR